MAQGYKKLVRRDPTHNDFKVKLGRKHLSKKIEYNVVIINM